MQNWVLDYDYSISASHLDKKRLMANIYENIHGIASLLNINDKLITSKRNVRNHPNIKRWENNILNYFYYLEQQLKIWDTAFWITKSHTINVKNFCLIYVVIVRYLNDEKNCRKFKLYNFDKPEFINDDLIKQHKKILYEKNPEFYTIFGVNDD